MEIKESQSQDLDEIVAKTDILPSDEENYKLPIMYRPFVAFENYMYSRYILLKEDNRPVSKTLRRIENLLYIPARALISFPNGNAMPGSLQKKSLESQGRNNMTYALWGLASDAAFQGVKIYAAWEAASTNTVAGIIAAGGFGLWTLYKIPGIILRGLLMEVTKRPVAFILIEVADLGYLQTKRGWRYINPAGRIKDTIKVTRNILDNYKNSNSTK